MRDLTRLALTTIILFFAVSTNFHCGGSDKIACVYDEPETSKCELVETDIEKLSKTDSKITATYNQTDSGCSASYSMTINSKEADKVKNHINKYNLLDCSVRTISEGTCSPCTEMKMKVPGYNNIDFVYE